MCVCVCVQRLSWDTIDTAQAHMLKARILAPLDSVAFGYRLFENLCLARRDDDVAYLFTHILKSILYRTLMSKYSWD